MSNNVLYHELKLQIFHMLIVDWLDRIFSLVRYLNYSTLLKESWYFIFSFN